MKKQILVLLLIIITSSSYSQSNFEKGYFLNNADQKIECLIYNVDWKNNPTKFDYKIAEDAEVQTETVDKIKEFALDGGNKYLRAKIDIDRSSDDVKKMTAERNPVFTKEELFLKVIIEGEASLYYYRDGSLKRYFYQKNNSEIAQLVYKRYRKGVSEIASNTYFKQQLYTEFPCENISQKDIEYLKYELNDIEKVISKYNSCQNSTSTNYNKKIKKDLFNLAIRPGLNFNSLNLTSSASDQRNVDFGSQMDFRVGLELEYIIPYHNNKWSIILEPTYRAFNAENTYAVNNIIGGTLTSKIEYNSVELPIGIRHTFFLNQSSSIFLNAQHIINFDLDPTLVYSRADGTKVYELDVSSSNNFAFGAGFKFQDKYILELRYQTSRDILNDYAGFNSAYKNMSIIIGYNFF